jgi:hypothetical protein
LRIILHSWLFALQCLFSLELTGALFFGKVGIVFFRSGGRMSVRATEQIKTSWKQEFQQQQKDFQLDKREYF